MTDENNNPLTSALRAVADRMDEDWYPQERMSFSAYVHSSKGWEIHLTVNAYSTFQTDDALACVARWAEWLDAELVKHQPRPMSGTDAWDQETRVEGRVSGVHVMVSTRVPVRVKVEVVHTKDLA